MKIFSTLFIVGALAASSQAAITFTIAHSGIKNDLGVNVPVSGGTIIGVVDIDGDGFNGTPYTAQNNDSGVALVQAADWLWDSSDYITKRSSFGGTNPQANTAASVNTATIPGYSDAAAAGYHWYTIWFATPNVGSGPGVGTWYYVKDNGPIAASGSLTGSDTLSKNKQVNLEIVNVPEPASLALLAVGGLLIARRRRA